MKEAFEHEQGIYECIIKQLDHIMRRFGDICEELQHRSLIPILKWIHTPLEGSIHYKKVDDLFFMPLGDRNKTFKTTMQAMQKEAGMDGSARRMKTSAEGDEEGSSDQKIQRPQSSGSVEAASFSSMDHEDQNLSKAQDQNANSELRLEKDVMPPQPLQSWEGWMMGIAPNLKECIAELEERRAQSRSWEGSMLQCAYVARYICAIPLLWFVALSTTLLLLLGTVADELRICVCRTLSALISKMDHKYRLKMPWLTQVSQKCFHFIYMDPYGDYGDSAQKYQTDHFLRYSSVVFYVHMTLKGDFQKKALRDFFGSIFDRAPNESGASEETAKNRRRAHSSKEQLAGGFTYGEDRKRFYDLTRNAFTSWMWVIRKTQRQLKKMALGDSGKIIKTFSLFATSAILTLIVAITAVILLAAGGFILLCVSGSWWKSRAFDQKIEQLKALEMVLIQTNVKPESSTRTKSETYLIQMMLWERINDLLNDLMPLRHLEGHVMKGWLLYLKTKKESISSWRRISVASLDQLHSAINNWGGAVRPLSQKGLPSLDFYFANQSFYMMSHGINRLCLSPRFFLQESALDKDKQQHQMHQKALALLPYVKECLKCSSVQKEDQWLNSWLNRQIKTPLGSPWGRGLYSIRNETDDHSWFHDFLMGSEVLQNVILGTHHVLPPGSIQISQAYDELMRLTRLLSAPHGLGLQSYSSYDVLAGGDQIHSVNKADDSMPVDKQLEAWQCTFIQSGVELILNAHIHQSYAHQLDVFDLSSFNSHLKSLLSDDASPSKNTVFMSYYHAEYSNTFVMNQQEWPTEVPRHCDAIQWWLEPLIERIYENDILRSHPGLNLQLRDMIKQLIFEKLMLKRASKAEEMRTQFDALWGGLMTDQESSWLMRVSVMDKNHLECLEETQSRGLDSKDWISKKRIRL